jgi:hypothetical protein
MHTSRSSEFEAVLGRTLSAFLVGFACLCAAPASKAAPMNYTAILAPENNSGVSGVASLTLNNSLLSVTIDATGLEPNQVHMQHIHMLLDSSGHPMPPLPPVDLDHDGFIETPEAVQFVGPPVLDLSLTPGSKTFPTTPSGTLNFSQTYDLSDPAVFAPGFDISNLLPLTFGTLELHGMTLGAEGGDGGEANGTPGYKAELPVAGGMIQAVPEPAALTSMSLGLILVAFLVARKRTTA